MKIKKKINIALTLIVLGVWPTVFYKYINRFFYSDELTLSNEVVLNKNIPDKIKKDTFELKPLSNDPFLYARFSKPVENRYSNVVKGTSLKSVAKPIVKDQPQTKQKLSVPFPTVKYFGFIKSKDKKEELILMKVGNTLHKTRLNENCDGVIVKKMYKDSLQVVFGKEIKVIKR